MTIPVDTRKSIPRVPFLKLWKAFLWKRIPTPNWTGVHSANRMIEYTSNPGTT